VLSCPKDALRQSLVDGTILLEDEKCTGCGWCILACDMGLITFDAVQNVPNICNLCGEEEEPRCVKACLVDALTVTTEDLFSGKSRAKSVTDLIAKAG